jgi:large subunit ribosomal protein L32e
LKRFRKAPWRKPRGKRSKMRSKERAKPALVSIGYRGPAEVRGYHPKGVPEILVYNVKDVERIQKKTMQEKGKEKGKKGKGKRKRKREYSCVIRIASAVGTRKKIQIVKAAVENQLYVANPAIDFVKISSLEELEALASIRNFVKAWYISEKISEDDRDDIAERAEEVGIEVMA